MAPYTMQIKINNQTDVPMQYLGSVFYAHDGDLKSNPSNIEPRSTGNGGTLEKVGGSDGLFGLVAYSCPDPTQMLVIYVTMPAATGALNHCYVALAPSNTPIGDGLADDAYNGRLPYETEGILNYPFTQGGKSMSIQVVPKVNDTHAYDTYSMVQISISGIS